MRFDEQKMFATTKEGTSTADVPVVMQRQVPVIQRVQRIVISHSSSSLTRKSDDLRWLRPDAETRVTIEYVPQVMAEIVEVVRLVPQERVQRRTVERNCPRFRTTSRVQIIPRSVPRSVSPTESSMCQM